MCINKSQAQQSRDPMPTYSSLVASTQMDHRYLCRAHSNWHEWKPSHEGRRERMQVFFFLYTRRGALLESGYELLTKKYCLLDCSRASCNLVEIYQSFRRNSAFIVRVKLVIYYQTAFFIVNLIRNSNLTHLLRVLFLGQRTCKFQDLEYVNVLGSRLLTKG